ncbi:MAG: short-chain dehydrogenase [Dyadobacter sp. 50-39]|uniref:SDR family NAD(P)-dependent oxidoreductase n=1 Tax=Dyadobacter sp. 50-39 TaxID=1895756 RepID=UPI00095B5B36|nr:SDR family oxidoreductase [Dyadobacter sp. 50-39]OJV16976.1 MAG: short-chain dehydrogenase [Dyadobacter sp. 50-39]|eukprot:Unigene10084_Nuclearia_a/m.30781 Unigene10084_Nuclearia_a/g.30781  ORF Unigene10084_Nuclearia_a/g.30781 Unigene10084_Nuclearia_a/m.30781 type:complete len:231 (+) Unigene10084_Nuclearia_a:37-729(+)
METWLINKSIVVIGGTAGVGLAAAQAFVRNGANVVVVGRNPESCLMAELNLGSNARAKQGDATQPQTTLDAIQLCIREFGSFDALYHAPEDHEEPALDGHLHNLGLESWRKTLDQNLTSLMLSNQAAIRTFMGMNKGGSILNLSPETTLPEGGMAGHAGATAKAAVIGFSKSIAATYAGHDIRINVISADTSVPADLEGAAVYLLSDHARFTNGQVLVVDGGRSVLEEQY